MTKAFCTTGTATDEEAYLPATFRSLRRCPARPDYVELCFETAQGQWDWCFAEPPDLAEEEPVGPLALALGRYGARAHLVADGALGAVLPSERALPMILGGAQVSVARRLVAAGR
jgi:hypothetical protein